MTRAPWVPTPDSAGILPERISGRRIGVFLAVSMGGAVAAAVFLRWLSTVLSPESGWVMTPAMALLYMPLPLVAGVVVERMAGRRMLIVRAWQGLRTIRRRVALLVAGILPAVGVMLLALAFSAALAGLGVPGAGSLVTTKAELGEQLGRISPVPLPPRRSPACPRWGCCSR